MSLISNKIVEIMVLLCFCFVDGEIRILTNNYGSGSQRHENLDLEQ
jgi:hypothetical protein